MALRPFHDGAPSFTAPNGVDLSPDDERLYVAHLEGVTMWTRATGAATRLQTTAAWPITGIDGLYACAGALVAVQQLGGLERVTWLELDPSGTRVVGGRILDQRHPAARHVTTGTPVGDAFYYVATSDVRRHRPDGSVAPSEGPRNTVVLRVALPRACR
jgi:hypothetical protein